MGCQKRAQKFRSRRTLKAMSKGCLGYMCEIIPRNYAVFQFFTPPTHSADTAGGNMTSNVHNSTIKYFPPIERLVIVNAAKFLEFFPHDDKFIFLLWFCWKQNFLFFTIFRGFFVGCWQHGNHDAKAFIIFKFHPPQAGHVRSWKATQT